MFKTKFFFERLEVLKISLTLQKGKRLCNDLYLQRLSKINDAITNKPGQIYVLCMKCVLCSCV